METKEIELILDQLEEKLAAHKEFKAAYDKKLSFDFNFFNFFLPGETKLSEILAYFLDPKQSHGQEDAFLKVFLNSMYSQGFTTVQNNFQSK